MYVKECKMYLKEYKMYLKEYKMYFKKAMKTRLTIPKRINK